MNNLYKWIYIKWIHRKCAKLSLNELNYFSGALYWECNICKMSFPCWHINDDEMYCLFNNDTIFVRSESDKLEKLKMIEPSSYIEYKSGDFEVNIDPENNFVNTMGTSCDYYGEEDCTHSCCNMIGLSILHLNARSLVKNIDSIKQMLTNIKFEFDVIAISESWLDENNKNDVNLDGYEVIHQLRNNKKGGGVCLYIRNVFRFNIIKQMCCSIDNLLECCTVQLDMQGKKDVLISCLYRTPGSNLE